MSGTASSAVEYVISPSPWENRASPSRSGSQSKVKQRTYHTVRQIAKEAERTIRGLYYTDPNWNQVCQQVTTMRTLIVVLDRAGA